MIDGSILFIAISIEKMSILQDPDGGYTQMNTKLGI